MKVSSIVRGALTVGHLFCLAVFFQGQARAEQVVQFESANYAFLEGGPDQDVCVVRSGDMSQNLIFSFCYKASAGLGIAQFGVFPGNDCPGKAKVEIAKDESKGCFKNQVYQNDTQDSERFYTLELLEFENAPDVKFGENIKARVDLVDDDSEGYVQFSQPYYAALESKSFLVTVLRLGGAKGEINVEFKSTEGDAKHGSDFGPLDISMDFGDGKFAKSQYLGFFLDDAIAEPDESFQISLEDKSGNSSHLGPNQSATVTIVDDDGTPNPGTLKFSQPEWSFSEGSKENRVYVSRVGGSKGKVCAQANYLSSPAYSTATLLEDYAVLSPPDNTVTFEDGDVAPKPITFFPLDDQAAEPDEFFQIGLLDKCEGSGVQLGEPTKVTILDNDRPGTLRFEKPEFSVNEGSGTLAVKVQRVDGSRGAVSVGYQSNNETALAGSDYGEVAGSLSWADGDVSEKVINVPILEDGEVEAVEYFSLTLKNPTGEATLGEPGTTRIQIESNDAVLVPPASNDGGDTGATPPATPPSPPDLKGGGGSAGGCSLMR